MAVGKNKRLTKGKKGGKKKTVDPFTKKEWYDVKTPGQFSVRNAGKTLVSKSQGLKLSTDGLKGRVLECNLADLNNDDDQAYRKIKLEIQEVQGRNCLTDFHGMDLTRDKQMQLVRKWHSLIEAHCKVKTTDGYILRMFCIAFTKRRQEQVKQTCYAGSSQVRKIRKKMVEVMQKEASKCMLRDLVPQEKEQSRFGKQISTASTACESDRSRQTSDDLAIEEQELDIAYSPWSLRSFWSSITSNPTYTGLDIGLEAIFTPGKQEGLKIRTHCTREVWIGGYLCTQETRRKEEEIKALNLANAK